MKLGEFLKQHDAKPGFEFTSELRKYTVLNIGKEMCFVRYVLDQQTCEGVLYLDKDRDWMLYTPEKKIKTLQCWEHYYSSTMGGVSCKVTTENWEEFIGERKDLIQIKSNLIGTVEIPVYLKVDSV